MHESLRMWQESDVRILSLKIFCRQKIRKTCKCNVRFSDRALVQFQIAANTIKVSKSNTKYIRFSDVSMVRLFLTIFLSTKISPILVDYYLSWWKIFLEENEVCNIRNFWQLWVRKSDNWNVRFSVLSILNFLISAPAC